MGKSGSFKVRFSGLAAGKHTFEFVVDNSFFEKLDYAQIEKGELQVSVELVKKPSHMELCFEVDGWVGANCDRCAIGYNQTLSGVNTIYVKFGDDFEEADDNLVIIPRDEHELDVSHMIYEFIRLSIPLKKIPCDESGDTSICDQEVLRVLDSSVSEEKKSNPMWSALSEIKDQLKEK
ncbi:MAG: DUF177 domain-containing protein [Flavobacteriales bacterium]|jgi:uncharacterized metal-binding protein YceD (DUF177 family)|nr:DUF177 domain-containing protein [Flavobacteriales bacterium]